MPQMPCNWLSARLGRIAVPIRDVCVREEDIVGEKLRKISEKIEISFPSELHSIIRFLYSRIRIINDTLTT